MNEWMNEWLILKKNMHASMHIRIIMYKIKARNNIRKTNKTNKKDL